MFAVKWRCTGEKLDEFETIEEAYEFAELQEQRDKDNDEYEPDSYIIEEV